MDNNTDTSQGFPKFLCVDTLLDEMSNLQHAYMRDIKDPSASAKHDASSEQKTDALQQKMDALQQFDLPTSANKDAPTDSDQPSLRNWNSSLATTAQPALSERSASEFTCFEESRSSAPKFAYFSEVSASPVQPIMTNTSIFSEVPASPVQPIMTNTSILHETTQEISKDITSSKKIGLPSITKQSSPSDLGVSRLGSSNSPQETIVPSKLSENPTPHNEQNDATQFTLEYGESHSVLNMPSLKGWNFPLSDNPSMNDEQTATPEFSIDTEESRTPDLGFELSSNEPPSSNTRDSSSMESDAWNYEAFENEDIVSSGFSSEYEGQSSDLLSMSTIFSDTPSQESDARFCQFTNSNIIESHSKSLYCMRLS